MGKGFALSSPNTPRHSENTLKVCDKSDKKKKSSFHLTPNLSVAAITKAADSFSFSLVLEEADIFST